jgi:hypothetical protein
MFATRDFVRSLFASFANKIPVFFIIAAIILKKKNNEKV